MSNRILAEKQRQKEDLQEVLVVSVSLLFKLYTSLKILLNSFLSGTMRQTTLRKAAHSLGPVCGLAILFDKVYLPSILFFFCSTHSNATNNDERRKQSKSVTLKKANGLTVETPDGHTLTA